MLEKVLCVYERVRETVLKQNLSLKFHFPTKVASSHFEKSFSVFLNEFKFHFLNILTHHLLEEGLHFVQVLVCNNNNLFKDQENTHFVRGSITSD